MEWKFIFQNILDYADNFSNAFGAIVSLANDPSSWIWAILSKHGLYGKHNGVDEVK